jgi:hypothetical protein
MPRGKTKPSPTGGAESKMDAVRKALSSLGYDAKPPALGNFIRENFGLTIPPNMISSYKSQLKSQTRKGRRGGRRGRAAAGNAMGKDLGGNVSLKDLHEIKTLAGRLGIAKLRKLVEVLA